MRNVTKWVSLSLVGLLLLGFLLIPAPEPVQATAYYDDYETITTIYNYGGCTGAQGMDVDDTYIYNVKIASSTQDNAFISRTHKDTGSTVYLTNAATGTYFFSNFYHANDLEVATINGETNLFVATSLAGSTSLLRFRLSGTTLTQIGSYHTLYNGSDTAISSARVMSVDDEQIHLLIKKGKYLYTADLPISATSGSITMTHAFTLDVANVTINGVSHDLTGWLHQGFGYYDGRIFVPITCETDMSISSITVFNVLGSSGTIQNDPSLSFYIDSDYYSEKFEIESCAICPSDGRLYFNTNLATSSDGDLDALHYISGYVYDPAMGTDGPDVYRWETIDNQLTSVTTGGSRHNAPLIKTGTVSGTTYTDARYSLSRSIMLEHDQNWILEWKSSGTWTDGALLMASNSKSKYEGGTYICRRKNSSLIAIGQYSGGTYYNYGLDLSDYGVDGTAEHVYSLRNRVAGDGSNMVYLFVDGKELGPLNNAYLEGTSQGTTSDWLNGKDFTFSYLGTDLHPLDDCKIDYIQVWPRGEADKNDAANNYRWGAGMTAVTGTGLTENTATALAGTTSGVTLTDSRFSLDKDVVLRHDRPWSVEWQATGSFTGGALLMAAAPTSKSPNAPFLFRNSGDTLIALGYHDGTRFHNYGVRLDAHGIDSTLPHTYRLTNRIASDGSNMVYLFVDDVELGPMNGYHVGGSNQGTTGDWVAGQDFTFSYLGTVQHNINADINNLQVWENGRPADHTPGHYRWETDMTAVSGNNPAQILSGSVTVGSFSGAYFQLNQPVVLRHDEVWSIQWSSTGSWKDTANGSLLLSASDVNNDPYAPYLYRRNASHIIAFGERRDGGHQNYGIKLSDHGIDGTAAHTCRITNRIASDGSNMAYLYVDGQELGPMNQHFIGGAAQGITSDWISGKDFVFNYLGTPDFTIGNCTIEYLQIDEACAHSYGAWNGSNPSCTAAGTQTRSCTLCGHTQSQTIAALGHSWTAATCTAAKKCTTCGITEGETLGHSYESTVTPPTCTTSGFTTHTCTRCGNSYTNNVTAARHNYQAAVTAPTCTDTGYTTYTCTACGDSYIGDTVSPIGHSYIGGICQNCGEAEPSDLVEPTLTLTAVTLAFEDEIFYNLYFTADDISSVVDMGLVTFAEKLSDGTHENAIDVIPGYEVVGSEYRVRTNGIAAKYMGDALYFRVYAQMTDGSYVYGDVAGYHAGAYAKSKVNSATSSDKLKALCVAMVNYGAKAQIQFNYKTDSLMNSFLTEEQKALVADYSESMVDAVVSASSAKAANFVKSGFSGRGVAVSFEGAFAVNYYFTPSYAPEGELTMYWWDLATYNSVDVLTKENATGSIAMTGSGTSEYFGAVEGIAAKDLDKGIYVSAVYTYNGTEYSTGVVAYSIGHYCKIKAAEASTMGDLAAATAVYGYYAKQYFA